MSETISVKDYCDCLRRHINAQQSMQDTFGRLSMTAEAKEVEAFIDGLRRAIEVAQHMGERTP